MSGDPYIKENERLEAEIARLQESINYLQIADNHHQELMAEKEEEIDRLRAELEIARQSDTDYQAHIENAKLRIELKKEEKFTMAAMDKAKVYQAALERLTQSADPWARGVAATALANERKALATEGK